MCIYSIITYMGIYVVSYINWQHFIFFIKCAWIMSSLLTLFYIWYLIVPFLKEPNIYLDNVYTLLFFFFTSYSIFSWLNYQKIIFFFFVTIRIKCCIVDFYNVGAFKIKVIYRAKAFPLSIILNLIIIQSLLLFSLFYRTWLKFKV